MAVILRSRALALSLVLLVFSNAVRAEIVIDRTRIVYPAGAREVTVNLKNEAAGPRLVQAWIDEGDAQVAAEISDVPFSLTPPIARMEAGQGKALRLAFDQREGKALASDRESVFWLNVLGVPPKPDGAGNSVQLAFRTRIKLFLRPQALSSPAKAPGGLKWRRLEGPSLRAEVHNPSAYYITLSSVVATADGTEYRSDDPPMLAPYSTVVMPLTASGNAPQPKPGIGFTVLDDNGATQTHHADWAPDK
ncbi:fimbrial biogenesis chaperone [Pseudomonas yamanorum]|uniref:Fimbria/pilus periplasmic chaperone n=1 Tax=Pseudomonas yamanorum TaxID=515393 RepID=A0A7Y8JT25_9PSED|nr:fimbria/pilus periplasmic chaperone [Pseudomonas yamanorum]NWE17071.1 fimbria/pilus periplasmic chaperone [Pseudomonas yamanorum]